MAAEFRSRISVRNSEACSKAKLGTSATAGIWAGEAASPEVKRQIQQCCAGDAWKQRSCNFQYFPSCYVSKFKLALS